MMKTNNTVKEIRQSIWKRLDFYKKIKIDCEMSIEKLLSEEQTDESKTLIKYYRKQFYEANGALDVLYDILRTELEVI